MEITNKGLKSCPCDIKAKTTDKSGKETNLFTTKYPSRVLTDINYDKKASSLSVEIYRDDHILCFILQAQLKKILMGTCSARAGFDILELNLLTGSYYISAELKDKKGHVLLRRDKLAQFLVFSEKKDHGIVYMDHEWVIGGIKNEEVRQKTQC